MVVPVMTLSGKIVQYMPLFTGSASIKNGVLHHAGDHSVWDFFVG